MKEERKEEKEKCNIDYVIVFQELCTVAPLGANRSSWSRARFLGNVSWLPT